MVDFGCVFGKDKFFISCLFNIIGYNMIDLWMHMNFWMKLMRHLWKKFLIEFNLFIQVNFVKELETSFFGFCEQIV